MNHPWYSHIPTNEFYFKALNTDDRDALVIISPPDTRSPAGPYFHSSYSLEDHIALVQSKNLRKAIIIAEDISFLRECPSLEQLSVSPSYSAEKFDFSPLYDMPNLKWLSCETTFGPGNKKTASFDGSRCPNLTRLSVDGRQNAFCISGMRKLKSLFLHSGAYRSENLSAFSDCEELVNLWFTQIPLRSLDGIESLKSLKRLELDVCSKLENLSALSACAETLSWLQINSCNKIMDFSFLGNLKNLEYLHIAGNNTIPDLSFIKNMPNLKTLFFTVKIQDGDLTLCKGIPDVRFVDRRHYSHKSKDFPKNGSIKTHLFYYETE